MKKNLFPFAVIVLFLSVFSLETIAQTTDISQPSPVAFKRIHGKSTCGTAGEMQVSFETLPGALPTIAEVRSNARAVRMVFGNTDTSQFATRGYVSYCIVSAENLPANKLWIRFHYENPSRDYWVTQTHEFKN